jgi:biopolymer transport protein ExbD
MALSSQGGADFGAPLAEINTTPLVDVMLVLFVIFLVTAPMLTQTVPLNLPKESVSTEHNPRDHTAIAINAKNQIFWNRSRVTPAELEERLRDLAVESPDSPVELYIDQQVPYARISGVLAAAQRSGISRLGFTLESN